MLSRLHPAARLVLIIGAALAVLGVIGALALYAVTQVLTTMLTLYQGLLLLVLSGT